jgi:hypothetical protein
MDTQTSKELMALLTVCFLDTIVLAYIILRSRWAGWRLIATVFFVFFGVMTFMSQIESLVFHILPSGMLPRLILMGVLITAPFSPLAVIILGKRKAGTATVNEPNSRLLMPANEWAWKLAVIAIAYMILYSTFGYFIAWKNPAIQAYYGGIDEGNYFAHDTILTSTPWFPFKPYEPCSGIVGVACNSYDERTLARNCLCRWIGLCRADEQPTVAPHSVNA